MANVPCDVEKNLICGKMIMTSTRLPEGERPVGVVPFCRGGTLWNTWKVENFETFSTNPSFYKITTSDDFLEYDMLNGISGLIKYCTLKFVVEPSIYQLIFPYTMIEDHVLLENKYYAKCIDV